jgi:hypothetical protein
MAHDQILMRRVLRRLAREYPSFVEISVHPELDTSETHQALFYLAEKRLVEPGATSNRAGQPREMLEAKITPAGLDWLEEPVAAPSELGDAAGPFELEALRHFLKQALVMSHLPQESRQQAIAQLMSFSGAEVKSLILRLLQRTGERPTELAELISRIRE